MNLTKQEKEEALEEYDSLIGVVKSNLTSAEVVKKFNGGQNE